MARNDVLARLAVLITANNAEFGSVMSQSASQAKAFEKSVNGLNGTLQAFGVGFGISQVIEGIKAAIGTAAQFEHTMSTVKAITGEVGQGFKDLEDDALRLGRSTQFTANEVGNLQVAYGRLGFTKNEILDATEATLDLAAATGEDLAKAADVAGSTIRGFGLSANQTQRVVDVMAASFNRTALGLENFSEAMKYVAPIAATANISVEDTTALLGTLADAGIRGSQAGTSLRKIITDLGNESGTLSEKLKKLADKGLTGAEAMSEVGRTAYASLLILSKNTEKTDAAAKSYQDVAGEAKAAANIINNDLTGSVAKLNSSWDGFINNILKSTHTLDLLSVSAQGFRTIILSLQGLKDENLLFKGLTVSVQGGLFDERRLKNAIQNLQEYRKELGRPINIKEFDIYIEKYDLSEKEVLKLKVALDKVNQAFSDTEKIQKQYDDFTIRNKFKDTEAAADSYINSIYKLISAEQQNIDNNKKLFGNGLDNSAFEASINSSLRRIGEYKIAIAQIEKIKQDYIKGKPLEIPAPKLGLIQQAEEELKRYRKAQDEAFSIDSIRYFNNLIQETEAKLKSLKESLPFNERRGEALPTNVSAEVPSLSGQQFLIDNGVSDKAIHSISETADALDGVMVKADKVKEKFINIGHAISQAIAGAVSDIAFALGEALGGNGGIQQFGKAVLNALIGFAKQMGEILVAAGFAALAADTLLEDPYTAIAGGIALLAVAGAASAALNASQNKYTGGRNSFQSASTQQYQTSPKTMQIELSGNFQVSGNDLSLALSNQNIRDQRIKPG